MFYKDETLGLFIDGYATFNAAKSVDLHIDFSALKTEFMRRGKIKTLRYYSLLDKSDQESPIRPMLDWLSYNGFQVMTKQPHTFEDNTGQKRIKGTVDVEMAIDMMTYAQHLDHIVLFSGNRDLTYAGEMVQRHGVRLSVVSTVKGVGFQCADELRRQADNFIDLHELGDVISK